MKKTSLSAIYDALVNYGYDNEEILNELQEDINKEEPKPAPGAVFRTIETIEFGPYD